MIPSQNNQSATPVIAVFIQTHYSSMSTSLSSSLSFDDKLTDHIIIGDNATIASAVVAELNEMFNNPGLHKITLDFARKILGRIF